MILKYIEVLEKKNVDDYYTPLIKVLKEDPERPFAKFIERHPQSILPKLYSQVPEMGLLEFLEDDPNHPLLSEIEKDPSKVKRIATMSPKVRAAMAALKDRTFDQLSASCDMITESFSNNDKLYIHEDEYRENFHKYFSGLSEKEESHQARGAWLRVTRAVNVPVHIVNDNGDTLFIHPGLAASGVTKKRNFSWKNFADNSKENSRRLPGATERYQHDFLGKVAQIHDDEFGTTNRKELQALYNIKRYFDGNAIAEVGEQEVIVKNNKIDKPVTNDDDWDIFE